MRPVTPAFLRALRGSHGMVARARVVAPGQTGIAPAGTEIPIVAGDVGLDASAKIRATLDMTTIAAWPGGSGDLLAPFGNEVFVERGIRFGNGIVEYVSQGYFRITTVEQNQTPNGTIRITAADRMAGIVDARLLAPRQYTAGTALGDVVADLVTEVYPAAVIEWDDSTEFSTLARSLVVDDRHAFLLDLVTAAGKVMRYDYRGVLVIASPPDPGQPVYTVDAGRNGVLVSMGRQLTRTGVYNAVVATGEAPDTTAPVRAVAVDDNPASPTRFDGPFGPVPRFYSSPFITTQGGAQTAAEAILRKGLGLPYNVDFGTIVNSGLEDLDPVQIRYPVRSRSRTLRSETHIIERLTVPLTAAQTMSGVTREQTLVSIGTLP